jgi:hypothetical protein
MKIQDLIGNVIKNSKNLGSRELPELLKFAGKNLVTGIAIAKEPERELYLAFINGDPEGAIYIDEKGTLYGDKAVMMLTDRENYILYEVSADIVDTIIMGCRIFEKSHLRKSIPTLVPEVGRKNIALGVLTIIVKHGEGRQNGFRVSVRKDGKIVGSDVTTDDGTVSFKLLHGMYECILQDRNQVVTTRRLTFDSTHNVITLDV